MPGAKWTKMLILLGGRNRKGIRLALCRPRHEGMTQIQIQFRTHGMPCLCCAVTKPPEGVSSNASGSYAERFPRPYTRRTRVNWTGAAVVAIWCVFSYLTSRSAALEEPAAACHSLADAASQGRSESNSRGRLH